MNNVFKTYLIILSLLFIPCLGFAQTLSLGTIESFALFTSNGAVANTGTSTLTGNIGSDIGVVSGFGAPTVHTGTIYNSDVTTAQAKTDLFIAYNQLMSIPATNTTHTPAFGSGETLATGVYTIAGAGSLAGQITLDGLGDSNAIFIFRFGGAFAVGASSQVILINNARSCNVFWVVEGAIALAEFTIMKGTLLANNAAVSAAANCDLEGRMLSTTGAIAFGPAIAQIPSCSGNVALPASPPCCSPEFGATIDFVIFTSNGAVSNVSTSALTEHIGSDAGAITGFALPTTVAGTIYSANSVTAQTKIDLFSLYNQLSLNIVTNSTHGAVFGGGETLTGGVYYVDQACSMAGNLTLDAQNDTDAVFIFKIRGTLTGAANSNMILINQASPCSIFWVVEGAISFGTNSVIKGTYISNNDAVAISKGVDIEGRLFSTNGAISLDQITADNTAPCHAPTTSTLLPIELLSFEVMCENHGATLEWSTASEINNDYYTIERSNDGINWQIISTVVGAGNSNEIRYYSYIDINNSFEMSYYRLKQTDYDGNYEYFKTLALESCLESQAVVSIYPNPANNFLNISFNFPEEKIKSISIRNLFGEIIFYSENYLTPILLSGYNNGVYILQINLESKTLMEKFVISN